MLRHILFDLDETLYPPAAGVMRAINARMTDYIVERLGLEPQGATELRDRYFSQYGTTLRGLALEHAVDPLEYLAYVHDISLSDRLAPDPGLRAMLERIPQPKHIFTNADTAHARRILETLGIADLFRQTFDIVFFEFECKPEPHAYRRALEALAAPPGEVALVEDAARNLAPARALGMRTVLVGGPGEADICIPTIYEAADALAQF